MQNRILWENGCYSILVDRVWRIKECHTSMIEVSLDSFSENDTDPLDQNSLNTNLWHMKKG